MEINIPKLSLVVLIGTSGSGKSTFAKKHFLTTEVLSSDYCRALVSDDENDLTVTNDAFDLLHYIASKRLSAGKLVVIDATNVQEEARKPLVELAREYHVIPVAIVFDIPEKICQKRNEKRDDRNFGKHVIRRQRSQLKRSIRRLKWEGFRHIFKLYSEEEVNDVVVNRIPLWNDRTDDHGPFDIIGDVHGCYDELIELIEKLGYQINTNSSGVFSDTPMYYHPNNRKLIFLGDIVDRGSKIIDSLKLVYNMVQNGNALCVPGNHDVKLMRKLKGKNVQITHGLAETLREFDNLPDEIRKEYIQLFIEFLNGLVSHFVLDDGKLVVSHAGLKQEMQGRGSGKVREFCLYGETTGETDEFGLPLRYNWAAEYRGSAMVVYGHTPIPEPEWLNRTINIDTGCVFGGKLTALRYPERELISADAKQIYCESVRPLEINLDLKTSAQHQYDDLLNAEDVLGKRIINTRFRSNIIIREENAAAALEVMSRFAANPKWLIYLPPTMSPSETSKKQDFLEYPSEAFQYYLSQGVPKVICEEKHMGSRAVVIICKDMNIALQRFGVEKENNGIVFTRTGRRFFDDMTLESMLIDRVKIALDKTNFWGEFNTDWVCLDCELMPWSAKAQKLLKDQYAAVGAAAKASIDESVAIIEKAIQNNNIEDEAEQKKLELLNLKFKKRTEVIEKYIQAYQQYCWDFESLDDLNLAPFHILATEGHVHIDKNHDWHMTSIKRICEMDSSLLLATPFKIIDLTVSESIEEGIVWWEELTKNGSEGMVVKPLDFIAKGKRGLLQPALKCRGREYLRIIYGPEYTFENNLSRLRSRGLGRKRSLAVREFALGIEALERFVRKEPLRRTHECVFGVLALESEPVDPRL